MVQNLVRSHKGKVIDIGLMAAKNGHVIAAGNANVNARGDLLGAGGKIIKTKEQLAMEYNDKNNKAVERVVAINLPVKEMLGTPTSLVTPVRPSFPQINKARLQEKTLSDLETLKKYDLGASIEDETK